MYCATVYVLLIKGLKTLFCIIITNGKPHLDVLKKNTRSTSTYTVNNADFSHIFSHLNDSGAIKDNEKSLDKFVQQ